MKLEDETLRMSGCRSDFEIAEFLGQIQIDGFKGLTAFDASMLSLDAQTADTKAQRAELITAVRGGKHMELSVTALTFRQRKAPNRRYLRLAADKLADRAPTWKGMPFLVDHNTGSMSASKGTILSSKLVQESTNVAAFEQVLHVVKPEAVIGFLDGTYRKFSIGWFALGPVMCSAHQVDVRASDSCYCYPGDTVMIDGKPEIVQYEFTDYEGEEVSAVVVPAVRDTSVEEVRAALTAELHLPHRHRTTPKERPMAFTRLAAALALAALAEPDEDRAVAAVTSLRERAAAAELDAGQLRTENARLTSELAVQTALAAAASAAATDALIADAYKAGKLGHGKDAEGKNTPDPIESLLRDYGRAAGRDALAAKVTAMPVRIPLGVPPIAVATPEPARQLAAVPSDTQLAVTAAQMGVPVNDLRAQYGLSPIAGAP